jgi:hypothetical protein
MPGLANGPKPKHRCGGLRRAIDCLTLDQSMDRDRPC